MTGSLSQTRGRPERIEIPLRDVTLSDAERRDLLDSHGRIDERVRESWDESGKCTLVRVPLPEPICAMCGERWGEYGCPTARAVVLLGIYERESRKDGRRIAELTEALTPRFGVAHLRNAKNAATELNMRVDEYTLIYGGIGLIDSVLLRMRDEWRRWFKHHGELKRIRADALYALSLDSDYYVWLTQEFDPSTSAIKRPSAPWDDPDWTKPTARSLSPADDGGAR